MTLALQTKNLELAAVDLRMARALACDRQEPGRIISAPVPPEWPPELLTDAVELLARS
jgi:hypothetical protein